MPTFADYTSAREFFAAVRDASIEADRTRRMLQRLEASEGLKGQSYSPRVASGNRDVMQRTDARIDYEERMRERIDEDYAIMELGDQVIYGRESGKGGIDALLGSAYADVVWWRTCGAAPWQEVAERVSYTRRYCMEMYGVAMDAVDAYGFEACADGVGSAQD